MPKKNSMILFGILVLLNTFYGCSGLKNEPVKKKYFDLNINLPASGQNSVNQGDTLLVKSFSINPAFDSYLLVYRVGKNEYINDYYSEFISYPAKLITEKISEALFGSLHFKSLSSGRKQDIKYRLSGKITKLYGDFQDKNNPKAIIEIRITLEKKTDNTFKSAIGRTYRVEEPILSPEPDDLTSGWNIGLEKIVILFISDFQTPAP